MPKPIVNHSRAGPRPQPTISLALDVQVGRVPGAPGAWPAGSGKGKGGGMAPMVTQFPLQATECLSGAHPNCSAGESRDPRVNNYGAGSVGPGFRRDFEI